MHRDNICFVGVLQRAILRADCLSQHTNLHRCLQAVDIDLSADRSKNLFSCFTDDRLDLLGKPVGKLFGKHELVMDALDCLG